MPFIPHTQSDVQSMLDSIGITDTAQLFDEIPENLKIKSLDGIPERINEMQISRIMHERAAQDGTPLCFAGGGAYEHHVPAAVWEVTTRGEFYSAYTPYQAEASQGTLQLIYEYQTMIASLTGMDVSNASLYDGASALAEAVLMAVRANRKSSSKRILVPRTVNPSYRKTAHTIVNNQGITLEELAFDMEGGHIDIASLPKDPGDFAALVIPMPNYFGVLEDVHALTDWAHQHNALVIATVNPMALAVMTPPGEWGQNGADIACGEGQPLGIPLSSGGPYFGFMCCKKEFVRQMPGRIVGRTVDLDGKEGFTLTLQAREQHIRRSKATSNICTNQGLMVTASTIYMSLLGPTGLQKTAAFCNHNANQLMEQLQSVNGVSKRFTQPFFHELVITLQQPVETVIDKMADAKIVAGISLKEDYPELGESMLVCVTETKTEQDMHNYCAALSQLLA